mmetsp:Transcript_15672/g.18206  ORF Transcript_15672/g.18206 Transcript_15672/m.18206 type:complete len:403 (-) Transcript_15672:131-1339(-)
MFLDNMIKTTKTGRSFSILHGFKITIVICFVSTSLSIFFSYLDLFQVRCYFQQTKLFEIQKKNTTIQTSLDRNNEDFMGDTNESDPNLYTTSYPRIAWLMSYPNSGTSFTMKLVGLGGNKTVATNYGLEADTSYSTSNVPLYPHSPHGPYLLNPKKSLPKQYILTKTHCGGRCADCSPKGYIETKTSFMNRCAQGSRRNHSLTLGKEIVWYDPEIVERVIHLIRNPFDNLVSNFHLVHHEEAKKSKNNNEKSKNWLNTYPNDMHGFRKWCLDENRKHAEEEKELLSSEIVDIFERNNIPCHAHFYRYAKWHDFAIAVTHELKLPALVIVYEEYGDKFNMTATKIFDFLEMEPISGTVPPFVGGKTYIDYFTESEREDAMMLVKACIENEKTWNLVQRYQEDG